MRDKDMIIINDYIENNPLSENNLDRTLDLVNKTRLSMPQKTIWLYTGYEFNEIFSENQFKILDGGYCKWAKRANIAVECNVLVDGRYMDSQRDITLLYRGSRNQRVIDVKRTMEKGEIVLWTN